MSAFSAKRDAAIARAYEAGTGACSRCGTPTPVDELSRYGTMCATCFGSYCREAPSRPVPVNGEERKAIVRRILSALRQKANPGQMVLERLQELRDAGVKLSPSQVHVMRSIRRMNGHRDELPEEVS